MEAARESGRRAYEVEALGILGDALHFAGSSHEAIDRLSEARQTAADAGSVEGLLFATDSLAECLVDTDHLEQAIVVANRGADDARRFGLDRRFGAMFRGQAGWALFELGRWVEAEAAMSHGLDIGHGRVWGLSVRARLLAAMGRTDEASASLAAILDMFPEGLPELARLELVRSGVDVLLVQGDLAGAVAMATQALEADYPSVGLRLGIAANGLRAAADLAESARARRDGSASADAMAAGEILGAEVARQRAILAGWQEPTPSKVAAASLADAELARLAGASDPELWAAIEVAYERVPMPFPVAYARFRRAEALLVKDRTKTMPTELLRAAYATCSELQASPMIASIEGLARRARIELVAPSIAPVEPGASPATGPSKRRPEDLGLSARELEVLALVADGRTNGEIAKALFITHQDGLHPRDPHPRQARGDESCRGGRDRIARWAHPCHHRRDECLRGHRRMDDRAQTGSGPSTTYRTEQEAFWAGEFGTDYIARNESDALLAANLGFFAAALRQARAAASCIELGANVGMNLRALKLLFPAQEQFAVEINADAARRLREVIPPDHVAHQSILDYVPPREFDLVLVKGVLIHMDPEMLPGIYDTRSGRPRGTCSLPSTTTLSRWRSPTADTRTACSSVTSPAS